MTLLLVYLSLALSVSFLCSIMEAVLLSTPGSSLISHSREGKKWALTLQAFKENIDRPLSAILTLNTIAHTVGAAGVGAQAVKVFGEAWFGAISAVLTLLILVLTEIIPKTVGATYWKALGRPSAALIRITILLTYPLVVASSWITSLISSGKKEGTVSREELSALADVGVEEGLLHEKEHRILKNLLLLKDVKITDVMTPRTVMATADESMTLAEFNEQKDVLCHSRIPVYSEQKDSIHGYVFRQKVFEMLAEGHRDVALSALKRPVLVVPFSAGLLSVWEMLLEKREHMVLVVDEYGGVEGLATMEDIIETVLGLEIVDEKDRIIDMQEYARQRWKQRIDRGKTTTKK